MRVLMTTTLLLVLAACSPTGDTAKRQETTAVAATKPAVEDDGGQALAFAAGKDLLGKPAPAVVLKTIDGRRIDLSKIYGKRPVYLKFWATWCVPCRQQMPAFQRDYEQFGGDMEVIAVNTGFNETAGGIQDYRRELKLTMPIVTDDGTLAAALNLRVTPQHVVIGRDGRIAYVGHLEDESLHRALIAAGAGGGAVAGSAATRTAPTFAAGEVVPARSVLGVDGRRMQIGGPSSARLRAIVFFSPWCEPYYRTSRPEISASCRRVREETETLSRNSGVDWLGVASGLWSTPKDLEEYRTRHKVGFPLTLDASGDLFRIFGVRGVPVVILMDRSGRIVRRLEAGDSDLERAISEAGGA